MEKIEELIETLKLQEKQLLNIVSHEPKNDVQKAAWEKALIYLAQVGELLDNFIPEREKRRCCSND